MVQMCAKELLGFVGKVLTPRVTFQDSRISVMLQTFFPWNCSFQTLTLISLKELVLHDPKSSPSLKWKQWKDVFKQPHRYTSGKVQLHCLLGNSSNTYCLGFVPRFFSWYLQNLITKAQIRHCLNPIELFLSLQRAPLVSLTSFVGTSE